MKTGNLGRELPPLSAGCNTDLLAQAAANIQGRTMTRVRSSDKDLWIDLDDGSRLTIRIQELIWEPIAQRPSEGNPDGR